MRPAWSDAFTPGQLRPVAPMPLPAPITPEWAWGGSSGAGVRVAVVDSGVDAGHPAVGGVDGGVVVEPDPHDAEQTRVVERPHEDLYGHGTAAAAIIRRAAPDCEIHSVRVLGSGLTGKAAVFAAGLRWAIEHDMHVVNLSLSSRSVRHAGLFHDLVDEAYFRRVMLVSAINNVVAPSFPSQFSGVFSVAAHDGRDPFRFDVNPHPPVEFGAPGIDIEVAWTGGGFITATGNSFAAPHITGLVARILGKHRGLTPYEMKTVLLALADNAAATGAAG